MLSRRSFARLIAAGAPATLLTPRAAAAALQSAAPPLPSPSSGEPYWAAVRDQFVMPPNLAVMNAANLCPSSRPVLEELYASTKDMDQDPSPANREKLGPAKEATRAKLAAFLRVTPEEIVLTRNTSESNNMVSNGVDLKAGDEVLIFSDNHPSNHQAWREKAKRFGFTVKVIEAVSPHPGAEFYVDAFSKALTPRTRVLAVTHLTSSVGDLMPVTELCRLARDRGVLSLVDGAQTFGLLDVDLSVMQPDFYTGSAHKWLCGPKETGVLFINRRAQDRIWPTIYSASPGATGVSRTFEGFGQRDEPALIAFGEALDFQTRVGRPAIERRSRELAQALMAGLRQVNGVTVWTSPVPERAVAVVSVKPGGLDPRKLAAALYEQDRIACATRGGDDRGGLRFSPHFYNSVPEINRLVAAIARHMTIGA